MRKVLGIVASLLATAGAVSMRHTARVEPGYFTISDKGSAEKEMGALTSGPELEHVQTLGEIPTDMPVAPAGYDTRPKILGVDVIDAPGQAGQALASSLGAVVGQLAADAEAGATDPDAQLALNGPADDPHWADVQEKLRQLSEKQENLEAQLGGEGSSDEGNTEVGGSAASGSLAELGSEVESESVNSEGSASEEASEEAAASQGSAGSGEVNGNAGSGAASEAAAVILADKEKIAELKEEVVEAKSEEETAAAEGNSNAEEAAAEKVEAVKEEVKEVKEEIKEEGGSASGSGSSSSSAAPAGETAFAEEAAAYAE